MDASLYHRLKDMVASLDALAEGGKPVCVAVTGPDLGLLALVRMPGVHARIEHMAVGKAYTCAKMGCSTAALHERLLRESLSLADFMDPGLTSMPGGVPMLAADGSIVAGIGVSGRSPEDDEALALRIRSLLEGGD